jgi:phosphoribosylformylglycinamidine synthase PurS subunit
MKFKATIKIMPKPELLDPQGKTVGKNLINIGIDSISAVRVGKNIECIVEADSISKAQEDAETSAKKLLANLIMEDYSIVVEELNG